MIILSLRGITSAVTGTIKSKINYFHTVNMVKHRVQASLILKISIMLFFVSNCLSSLILVCHMRRC